MNSFSRVPEDVCRQFVRCSSVFLPSSLVVSKVHVSDVVFEVLDEFDCYSSSSSSLLQTVLSASGLVVSGMYVLWLTGDRSI